MEKNEFGPRVKEILSSPLFEFVDLTKFMKSKIASELFDFSIHHMRNCGDSIFISRVLHVFEKSNYYSTLLDWFCISASLTYEIVDGAPILKRRKEKNNIELALSSHMKAHGAGSSLKGMIQLKNEENAIQKNAKSLKTALKNKRVIYVRKSSDLMDSRLMYEGSYGTGKRR